MAVLGKAFVAFASLPLSAALSVNVSPATMESEAFAAALRGLPLDRLILEVTEHAPIEDYLSLRATLEPYRSGGITLAVDDAGAGFSSLRHIIDLKPDLIKLDVSLTRNVDTDPARRAIASALIFYARETGSAIVAEGIETPEELQTLKILGVQCGQGYLLGRPQTLEMALNLVTSTATGRSVG